MMWKSEDLHQYAENCAKLAEYADQEADKIELKRIEQAWIELAANQDWLDGVTPKSGTKAVHV